MKPKLLLISVVVYVIAGVMAIIGCTEKEVIDTNYDERLTEYIKGSVIRKIESRDGYVFILTEDDSKRICIEGRLLNSHE